MNLILGGGDAGKSTILDAISLLFSASNTSTVSEMDYWRRDVTGEFTIEAVVSLPEGVDVNNFSVLLMPWEWDGQNAGLPADPGDGDVPEATSPVYRLRVRGTADLELIWEVVQPDDSVVPFSAGFRRRIGLIRLSTDDRNDRDLRLVYGSALDRLLDDPAIRARIAKRVAEQDLSPAVGDNGVAALKALGARLSAASLPSVVQLGLTSSQGLSIGALIGLLANQDGVELPLMSWGAGTRRLAALEIAAATQANTSITVIDEIERGLEPYRLRQLLGTLDANFGQCFVTTHSPVAIQRSRAAKLWYLDATGAIGELVREKIATQQERDPETFLARLAVIAEGPTEIGFLERLLRRAFRGNPLDSGVRVCNGQGNDQALALLEALGAARLSFAAIVDDEGTNPVRWARLKGAMGPLLLQWDGACTEQAVINLLPEAQLPTLLKDDSGGWNGNRLRTLAIRLAIEDKSFQAIEQALILKGRPLRSVIIDAATGNPDGAPVGSRKHWQAHSKAWFKSQAGGHELADLALTDAARPELEQLTLPFLNAILVAVKKPPIMGLDRV